MDWVQVLTILGSNIALFLWATRQARADFFHLDRKLDENRKETTSIVNATKDMIGAIQQEMKDFHTRLCTIEERNKGK